MDNANASTLLLLAIVAGVFLYSGGRRTLGALKRRGRELELTRSGVRAYGTVSAVGPLDRPSGRHSVTVRVDGGRGDSWSAVDDSGTGGYLLREGTPVTVLYAPKDRSNARLERAAFPESSMGDYPLFPDGGPKVPSLAAALSPVAGGLVIIVVLVLFALGWNGTALNLVPSLFVLIGLGLLAHTAFRLLTGAGKRPDHSASATAVVTDSWTETRHIRRRDGRGRTVRLHPFTVHFRAPDGREVHVRHPVATSTFAPALQQQLRVAYDPAHPPRYSLVDHPGAGRLPVLAPLFMGVVFIVLGTLVTLVFWTGASPF